jgi:S-layer family protein
LSPEDLIVTEPLAPGLSQSIEETYTRGYACHGDLDLTLGAYTSSLIAVIRKHEGKKLPAANFFDCFSHLHTDDLYLSFACSKPSQAAWSRFYALYQSYTLEVARLACTNADTAAEIASTVLSDMFLPNRSGRSRIACYDRQKTLAIWLRVMIMRRAINEYQRKSNKAEPIESVVDLIDDKAITWIEVMIRSKRYETIAKDSFNSANGTSNPLTLTIKFSDVGPDNIYYNYVNKIADRRVTVGYGNGIYGPTNIVPRDQMAAFIQSAIEELCPPRRSTHIFPCDSSEGQDGIK